MFILGKKIRLRPARKADRRKIFLWLTQSDVTPSMMGMPNYPDNPVPSWKEFCDDYKPHFFNSSGDGKGRNFIIIAGDEEVGAIGYDLLDMQKNRVVVDIWMRAEKYCNSGYGSDALNTLCDYLYKTYGITKFLISPSARNKRAIAAYRKSGFEFVSTLNKKEQEREFCISEYDDNVLMIKKVYDRDSEMQQEAARDRKI